MTSTTSKRFTTFAEFARAVTALAEELPPDTKVAYIDEFGSVTLTQVSIGHEPGSQRKPIVCVQ